MYLYSEMKRLYTSFQEMITSRKGALRRNGRGGLKRPLVISAPYNFEQIPVTLPGLTPEEILVLREKAAATRLGIHADSPPSIATYSVSAPSSSSNSSTPNPNVTGVLPPPPPPIITNLHTSGPGRSSSRAGSSMRSSSARSGTISRSESMARIPHPSNLRHYASSEEVRPMPMPMPIPSGGGLPAQSNHSLLLLGDLDDDVVSPLELDSHPRPGSRSRGHVNNNVDPVGMFPLDLDFEHLEREFELGSPISPLSPPSKKNTPRGSPKGSVSERGAIRI
ncbi:hypothetical protein QC762_300705 [Podospora pseudocomata]|uniref:Autophagy-related protein 13 n=1 Tax=Podospora pseudocomata TaxID=2093779 RepID=A0ABR0GHL3_9PEZI|nr:hypothetical protein QC762_300705 [Podospora pseudocomata]